MTGKVSLAQLESKVIKSRELIALRKFSSENEIPEANLILIDRAIKKSFEQIDKAFPSKTEVIYMNDHKVLEILLGFCISKKKWKGDFRKKRLW